MSFQRLFYINSCPIVILYIKSFLLHRIECAGSKRPTGERGVSGEQERPPAEPSSREKDKPLATAVPRDGAIAASRGDSCSNTRSSNLLATIGDSVPSGKYTFHAQKLLFPYENYFLPPRVDIY